MAESLLLVPKLGYAALFVLFAVLALVSAGLLATLTQSPKTPSV